MRRLPGNQTEKEIPLCGVTDKISPGATYSRDRNTKISGNSR